jgi:hypothetical protein
MVKRAEHFMTQTTSVITISDELSSEVATAILTKQKELNRDPRELMDIVLTVHGTLRELSAKARESRVEKIIASYAQAAKLL